MTPPRASGVLHGCVVSTSRNNECTAKQTTVRLREDLADNAEAVAPVKGVGVDALIIDALKAEIERVRRDEDFTSSAKRLLDRDRELLERLAQWRATSHWPSTSG